MIIEMEKTNKVNIDTIKWVIKNKIGLNRHELERREAKTSHESSGLNKPVVNNRYSEKDMHEAFRGFATGKKFEDWLKIYNGC